MKIPLDDDGQPAPFFNLHRREDRTICEMLGLCKGLIADGVVTAEEAGFLRHWIAANPEAVSTWPCSAVAKRLQRIYADGRVTDEEREDLLLMLRDLTGEGRMEIDLNPATRLPLDDPPPKLVFSHNVFVFTGRFFFGPRRACEEAVLARGGLCEDNVTRHTDVLVIGDLGSRDWAHTSHGRKIERAVEYKQNGCPIKIVGEEHWAKSLEPIERR